MKAFKIFGKIMKVLWLILGILILLWTGFWYYKSLTIGDLGGVMVTALLMGMGFYALLFYIPVTIVLVIIYLVLKSRRKKTRETKFPGVLKNQKKRKK